MPADKTFNLVKCIIQEQNMAFNSISSTKQYITLSCELLCLKNNTRVTYFEMRYDYSNISKTMGKNTILNIATMLKIPNSKCRIELININKISTMKHLYDSVYKDYNVFIICYILDIYVIRKLFYI